MAVDVVFGQSWTREHHEKGRPLIPSAARTSYPNSLSDVIELCTNPASGRGLHAAGSHWALSDAALSDVNFIETHDPRENRDTHPAAVIKPALGYTIPDVIPAGLSTDYLDWLNQLQEPHYLMHVEAGKRIYQLYAELDRPVNTATLTTLGGYMLVCV